MLISEHLQVAWLHGHVIMTSLPLFHNASDTPIVLCMAYCSIAYRVFVYQYQGVQVTCTNVWRSIPGQLSNYHVPSLHVPRCYTSSETFNPTHFLIVAEVWLVATISIPV
jgi:hypothetical protein